MSHPLLCILLADNYAGHSTFSALHYTMIIVVLLRGVKFYEKTNFVLYPTEMLCTSLIFSNYYNSSVLTDLARRTT
jgi:hypothetical protein